jgi:hypothetical protein
LQTKESVEINEAFKPIQKQAINDLSDVVAKASDFVITHKNVSSFP